MKVLAAFGGRQAFNPKPKTGRFMSAEQLQARHLIVTGRVQGVGFRPFVNRLADQLNLTGWVRNQAGQVEIWLEGHPTALDNFQHSLIATAPPLARPDPIQSQVVPVKNYNSFSLLPSLSGDLKHAHIPPDYFMCADCLAEMQDKTHRRYRYPFTNCTQCGPRYTLIKQLPYDRPNTSMVDFPLCHECLKEYTSPLDRRFHAQPLACPECGPSLCFNQPGQLKLHDNETALKAAVVALKQGLILAVKGIGGYHLLCSATSEAVVTKLRVRKHRAFKPFAVLLPWTGNEGLDWVNRCATPSPEELTLLKDPIRPIVLIKKALGSPLATAVAPNQPEFGLMLPYSPLHYLLLEAYGEPIIATSANISGEPVLTDAEEVETRLSGIADAFLHHNRPILRPADDSIYQMVAGQPQALRLGRGVAPVEINLPFVLKEPVLAVGGQMKNTICLAWDNRLVMSPHIGDLGSPRSLQIFTQTIKDLTKLYGVTVKHCVCDSHPDYTSTRWAEQSGLQIHKVFHHHAHASALVAEHAVTEPVLVFTWDGTGYGEDGHLWGGEGLLGQPGGWQRVSSFKQFRLPGGDKASREPWRSALALCWEQEQDWSECPVETTLLKQAWQKDMNSPISSSVGRLFDAAAALTHLVTIADFEGHAPMTLEAAAYKAYREYMGTMDQESYGEKDIALLNLSKAVSLTATATATATITLTAPVSLRTAITSTTPLSLPLIQNSSGVWLSDWAPLLAMLQNHEVNLETRSLCFHNSLALALITQAKQVQQCHPFKVVGLTGGVFQNKLLTELVMNLLEIEGFTVLLPKHIPSNDAGISFGQIIEAVKCFGLTV